VGLIKMIANSGCGLGLLLKSTCTIFFDRLPLLNG